MSVHDLTFTVSSANVYTPLQVNDGAPVTVTVTNNGSEDLSDLGFYIQPATSLGDVDNPAEFPPETDYQELLEWGTATNLVLDTQGGLKATIPQNSPDPDIEDYFRRGYGDSKSNKIPAQDIAAGASYTFELELENPTGVAARRIYADIVME